MISLSIISNKSLDFGLSCTTEYIPLDMFKQVINTNFEEFNITDESALITQLTNDLNYKNSLVSALENTVKGLTVAINNK